MEVLKKIPMMNKKNSNRIRCRIIDKCRGGKISPENRSYDDS